MITNIFFFANGNVACTDEQGQQVPEWQPSLLTDHLRKMLAAGVITRETKLFAAGREGLVGDWIAVDDSLEVIRTEASG